MCVFGGQKQALPPPVQPIAPPPEPADKEVTRARDKARAAAALAQGRGATILTSGLGLTSPAATAPKTILGA